MAFIAAPVSKSIGAHYVAFAMINFAFLGVEYADASILAVTFTFLAVVDVVLIAVTGRFTLMASCIASVALALETMMKLDWLLSHVEWLSLITNTIIIAAVIREYVQWMRGKFGRLLP